MSNENIKELSELIEKAITLGAQTFNTSGEPHDLYNYIKFLARTIALRKLNEVKAAALEGERHSDISWCDDAIKTISEDKTMYDAL